MVNNDQVNSVHDQAKVAGDNRVRDKVDLNVVVKMVGDKVVREMDINRALKVDRVISLNMDTTVRVLVDRLLTVKMDAQTLAIKILIDWAN